MTPKEWLKVKYMRAYLSAMKREVKFRFINFDEDDLVYTMYKMKTEFSEFATLASKLDKMIQKYGKDKLLSFSVDFFGEEKKVEIKLRW